MPADLRPTLIFGGCQHRTTNGSSARSRASVPADIVESAGLLQSSVRSVRLSRLACHHCRGCCFFILRMERHERRHAHLCDGPSYGAGRTLANAQLRLNWPHVALIANQIRSVADAPIKSRHTFVTLQVQIGKADRSGTDSSFRHHCRVLGRLRDYAHSAAAQNQQGRE